MTYRIGNNRCYRRQERIDRLSDVTHNMHDMSSLADQRFSVTNSINWSSTVVLLKMWGNAVSSAVKPLLLGVDAEEQRDAQGEMLSKVFR